MKSSALLLAVFLTACASLSNGARQTQPVLAVDLKSQTWYTTCSGAVEDWFSCQKKARKTCQNGYEVLKQNENSTNGVRELTFMCK